MSATNHPAPMTARTARFWDRVAEGYAKKPVPDEGVYQEKLRITRELLPEDAKVLEFGCGTGSTALALAPYVGRLLATDVSAKMIEIALGKQGETAENVLFRQASFDELDQPDESFDVVLGHSILHLLEDRDAAIARVWRLLRPGGLFISSTACIGADMPIFRWIGPIGKALGLLPYVAVFKDDDLVRSMTEAGFAIERRWRPGRGRGLFLVARKPA
ncbi:MAG: class I SAM-dependent methyltransferase [Pseudomonadota bacterium]